MLRDLLRALALSDRVRTEPPWIVGKRGHRQAVGLIGDNQGGNEHEAEDHPHK